MTKLLHRDWRLVQGMTKLLHRDWWSRLWVVQEVLLAREVLYQCGQKKLTDADAHHLMTLLDVILQASTAREISYLYERLEMFSSLWILRQAANMHDTGDNDHNGDGRDGDNDNTYRQGAESDSTSDGESEKDYSLRSLLVDFSRRQTTKPVDKIYGLLGLADDRDKYAAPDYSRTHVVVFAEVARVIIEDQANLDFLQVAGIGDSLGNSTLGLPSWAPDWTTRRYHCMSRGRRRWRACGDMDYRKEYWCLPASGTLLATGILVDIVSATCSVLDGIAERRLLKLETLFSDGEAAPYLNGKATRLQAYFRTLLCGCGLVSLEQLKVGSDAFHDAAAAFLYELGEGIEQSPDENILGMKSRDYVVRFLRWMREDRRGRTDEQILEKFGNQAQKLTRKDDFDQGAKSQGGYRLSRISVNNKCGGYVVETETGFIGMASDRVRKGDAVCVLFGCSAPLIMRQQEDHWTLVQACYVEGLMDGEVVQQLRDGKLRKQEFRIV
jgi:hypothetical protein